MAGTVESGYWAEGGFHLMNFLIAEISAIRNGSFALFSASYGNF